MAFKEPRKLGWEEDENEANRRTDGAIKQKDAGGQVGRPETEAPKTAAQKGSGRIDSGERGWEEAPTTSHPSP